MPKINLNKFSRAKTNSDTTQPTETKRRGRPSKKQVQFSGSEPEPEPEPEPELEEEEEIENQSIQSEADYNCVASEEVVVDSSFLEEFDNTNYKDDVKPEKPPKEPKQLKLPKQIRSLLEDDNDLFDDVGSEILGRDRLELIAKLNQYKSLFPEELKKFKVKKNATTEEMKSYLAEMECIVDTSSIENFMTDSILQCIRMTEGASAYTKKYDIRGCAELLQSNKQFHSLCKQLYVKYKVFSKVPCEYQLIMLVSTTAYICNHKNRNSDNIENFLNQQI